MTALTAVDHVGRPVVVHQDLVVPSTTEHGICAAVDVEVVASAAALDDIVAAAVEDEVVAGATEVLVVAGATVDRVRPALAVDRVGVGRAMQVVVTAVADDDGSRGGQREREGCEAGRDRDESKHVEHPSTCATWPPDLAAPHPNRVSSPYAAGC